MSERDLLIRNENIQRLFDDYVKGRFIVNRKYQRKLVWTLGEKQKFIDSIMKNYPVPLFLLASIKINEKDCYEIIDGMQRLDAIFSFIVGDYPVEYNGKELFFDLESMVKTKELVDTGKLKKKINALPREICTIICNYQLSLSITHYDDNNVEEIFRRINASGHSLSNQDLRQAGAVGSFATIVRKLSEKIRQDVSPEDILELSCMKKISISSGRLPYGINIDDIFWVKHEIISDKNIRISRDEELIAQIVAYIIFKGDVSPRAYVLDEIYGHTDKKTYFDKAELAISKIGFDNIVKYFMRTFDEVRLTLEVSENTFSRLLFNDEGKAKPKMFQVLFLAFYNLNSKGYVVSDRKGLIEKLSGLGYRRFSDIANSNGWDMKKRIESICALEGIIKESFEKRGKEDPAVENWINKVENILNQSNVEQQLYDFKIGMHNIDERHSFNQECFHKIIKTLTAMANMGKNKRGYVIVGIADDECSARKHAEHYNVDYDSYAKRYKGFYIVGVEKEVRENVYKNEDDYFFKIKELVKKEPIEENVKSRIMSSLKLVLYYNKTLLVFQIDSFDNAITYDNKFYIRYGNSVEEVTGKAILELVNKFSS